MDSYAHLEARSLPRPGLSRSTAERGGPPQPDGHQELHHGERVLALRNQESEHGVGHVEDRLYPVVSHPVHHHLRFVYSRVVKQHAHGIRFSLQPQLLHESQELVRVERLWPGLPVNQAFLLRYSRNYGQALLRLQNHFRIHVLALRCPSKLRILPHAEDALVDLDEVAASLLHSFHTLLQLCEDNFIFCDVHRIIRSPPAPVLAQLLQPDLVLAIN